MPRQRTLASHGLMALALLASLLVGALSARPPAGQSERLPPGQPPVVDPLPPGHFLAGGERALPVLEEISATLKRIDERLDRLEKLAAQATAQPTGQE
ncbi:MAG: hypothetical protein ACYC6Y_18685 [Thermoguttaceae bacterium]